MEANKKFGFVDGLSGLYLPAQKPLPRGGGQKVLLHPNLEAISRQIQQAVQQLNGQDDQSRVLLVIDQLDLLLATGGTQVGAVEVGDMLLGLREVRGLFTTRLTLI